MKILVVCQYYYPEQFRINDICETLVKKENEVTVLTGLPNYPRGKVSKEYKFFRKRKEKINGVNVIRSFEIGRRRGIIFRVLNYLSYMISASIKACFMKEQFDVVYVYQLSPVLMAVPGIIYKKRHNTKMVLYCLDLWPESVTTFGIKENTLIYKLIDKISRKIYNKADEILVSSETFKQDIKKKLKQDIKIEYIPQYSENILSAKTHKWHKEINFVFAGNIGKAQSVETIIKAANELKENSNIKIHIVGDGSSLQECKDLVKKLNLNNVIFYGKKELNEMQQYYNLADAMLVTLTKDAFASKTLPGKVQSCMATGNPIIAAADGETKKIIENAKCGYCVPAEDYKALANKMIEFASKTKVKIAELENNSQEYYNKNFKKDIIINKLIKVLEKEGIKNV